MANGDEQNLNYQRETVRILREQTDALKQQQRVAQQTSEQNKAQLDASRALARIAADQATQTGEVFKNLNATAQITKDLAKAEKTREALAREFKLASFSVKKILAEQLRNAKDLEKNEKERLETSKKIDDSLGLSGKFLGTINKFLGTNNSITKEILENTRAKLASEKGSIDKVKGFNTLLTKTGETLTKNLVDPLVFVEVLLDNSSAINRFQKELSISFTNATLLRDEFGQIAANTGDVFITSKKLQESFFGLAESAGFIADFSGQTLETFTNLEQRLNLSTKEASDLTLLFKLQGDNTEGIASNTFDSLTNTLKLSNATFTVKQIIGEVANTSAAIKVSLGANPVAIGEAVIAAKELGAELSDIDQIASSILDFESSISSELEAELLTGKQLNLERARLLALNNDFKGVAEEITQQGIDFNFFQNANRIQQEAIANSLGLSRDRLAEITLQQEMQTMSSAEIRDNFGEGAYQQSLALSASEKFAAAGEKIKGIFSDLVTLFTPLIDGVALFADLLGKVVGITGRLTPLLGIAAAFTIFKSFAAIPLGLGIPLAIAAVGGMFSLAKDALTMNDGIINSQGGMVVSGPQGMIQLNKNDSIIAGTNLGGGGIDYDKMAMAMSKAQVNVTTKYNSFRAYSTTSNGGRYQSSARYESKFV